MFGKRGAPMGNKNAAGNGHGGHFHSGAVKPVSLERPGSITGSVYNGIKNNSYQHAVNSAFAGRKVHSGGHAVGGAIRGAARGSGLALMAGGIGYMTGNGDDAGKMMAGTLAATGAYGAGKQYTKSKAGKTMSKIK